MNVRHPMGVLHSFSIKNIFYDKMDLRLFYFRMTIFSLMQDLRNRFFYKNKNAQFVIFLTT